MSRETDGGGMDNQGAQIEAWRTRALTAEADAIRLAGVVAESRAEVARVERARPIRRGKDLVTLSAVESERDALRATVTRVEALADQWDGMADANEDTHRAAANVMRINAADLRYALKAD